MAWQIVPLMAKQNNSVNVQLDLKKRATYLLFFRFNPIGEYWTMDVSFAASGEKLVSGVPLLPGEFPAEDLFRQLGYLDLGACGIVPLADTATDRPSYTNIASEFAMVWGED